MAVIRMIKAYGSNVADEVCGQPDEIAARLVKAGIAVYVTAAPVQAVEKVTQSVSKAFEEAEKTVEVVDVEEKTKAKKRKG